MRNVTKRGEDSKKATLHALRRATKAGDEGRARELLHEVLQWDAVYEILDTKRLFPRRDAKQCLRLTLRKPRRGETQTGSCLGGVPLLPKGTRWPVGARGPLPFVGQLDFGALAKAHRGRLHLPAAGVVGLFYDDEHAHDARRSRAWKLVFVPEGTDARLARSEDLDPVPLRLLDAELAPPLGSPRKHQVGGAPAWVQGDARPALVLAKVGLSSLDISEMRVAERRGVDVVGLARTAGDWRLLWQIPSTSEVLEWNDCGTLYVLIRENDLAAHRFDEAVCIVQHT